MLQKLSKEEAKEDRRALPNYYRSNPFPKTDHHKASIYKSQLWDCIKWQINFEKYNK